MTLRIIAVIALCSIAVSAHADGVIPVGRAEFDFVYEKLERQEALAKVPFQYLLGPAWFVAANQSAHPFSSITANDNHRVVAFGMAGEQFSAAKSLNTLGYERIAAGGSAQPQTNLQLFANFRLDEQLASDPSYTGKKWRGLAGEVENAFAQYHHERFDITAGRFAQYWGTPHSLVLSSQTTLDGFAYTFRWGRLSLSYRLARLNGLYPDRDSTLTDSLTENENRYFAGHRLDMRLSDNINVGLFETVIFGGPGRQIDLYYLNPILFYHSAQLNDGADDNTILGFDVTVRPIHGLKLYGQLLVDDFQIDKKQQSDQEPNQFGILTGGYLADIFPYTDLRWEYSRVTNWTFNQPKPRNRYTMNNTPIGGADGNDYQTLSLSVLHWLSDDIRISFDGGFRQQGEGRINAEWTAPWMDVSGNYHEAFPTGTVEQTITTGLGLTGYLTSFLYFDCKAGVEWVRNDQNIAGADRTSPYVRANIASFFFKPISIE